MATIDEIYQQQQNIDRTRIHESFPDPVGAPDAATQSMSRGKGYSNPASKSPRDTSRDPWNYSFSGQ